MLRNMNLLYYNMWINSTFLKWGISIAINFHPVINMLTCRNKKSTRSDRILSNDIITRHDNIKLCPFFFIYGAQNSRNLSFNLYILHTHTGRQLSGRLITKIVITVQQNEIQICFCAFHYVILLHDHTLVTPISGKYFTV